MSKETLQNWKGTVAVMGVDWGDSGKGRLVDDLASRADVVARYNGGSNTGHTVKNYAGEFALHIIPSGIFSENATCLIGRNVAVDLESLATEMDQLNAVGINCNNLIIDEQSSLTMPWHKMLDGNSRENAKIGTTGKGVGPTYADRTARRGLLVKDLFAQDFANKVQNEANFYVKHFDLNLNQADIISQYKKYAKAIEKFIGNTISILRKALVAKQNILFEGAQGYFLDIDAGTYPFVTSSNPGTVGIWRCFDLHPSNLSQIIGITKSYMTRVGEGPMPTIIDGKEAEIIIEKGKEVGTTTGRIRRPGWLDLVLIEEAVKVNGITSLAITKLDILSHIKKIKVCVGYKIDGQKVGYISHDADFIARVQPVYEELEGWQTDITQASNFDELPKQAKVFIRFIEKKVKVPVKFIGVGPRREQAIYV